MPLTEEHRKNVCKPGQGAITCAYLGLSPDGWGCQKGTAIEFAILQRLAEGTMNAQGDNCEGVR